MDDKEIASIQMVDQLWIEVHQDDPNARDVIVKLDNGAIFTALFVTVDYLRHQMQLTYELSKQVPDAFPVRFAALDVPHVLVENLNRDTIEDTLDNLFAMDMFESMFTRVTDDEDTQPTIPVSFGRRATQEVAAVVLQEVLVVE
ncbi:MAG: hypothetical protein MUF87_20955 [Anaerolineae bacterium]|nr:hypothetical protein [Anaerolineae bacterium]